MKVAIVGGGLAGLVVAVRRVEAGDEVVVFEGSARLGGQLHTESLHGFNVEHGAEGFVARSEAVPSIARAVGVGADIVDQLVQRSYGFDGTSLKELQPGEAAKFLGFQVAKDELGRGIRSFRDGMQALPTALAAAIAGRARIQLERQIVSVRCEASARVTLTAHQRAPERFDAVVLATNAAQAAALLTPEIGPAAEALGAATTLSSVTVSLAYARDAVEHPLDGTGFVVALDAQQDGLRACTFSSTKLPARAPASHALLRLFFRPAAGEIAGLDDSAWLARATRGLSRVLSLRSAPQHFWVSRWGNALPVFDAAHVERVRTLESALTGRGVFLAGAAFHGSGIDAAVRSAENTALALASYAASGVH